MDAVGCLFNAVRFLSKGPPVPGSSPPGSDSPIASLGVRKGAMMTGRKLLELFGRFCACVFVHAVVVSVHFMLGSCVMNMFCFELTAVTGILRAGECT